MDLARRLQNGVGGEIRNVKAIEYADEIANLIEEVELKWTTELQLLTVIADISPITNTTYLVFRIQVHFLALF